MTAAVSGLTGRDDSSPNCPQVWVLDTTEKRFDALADTGLASEQERGRADALSDAPTARRLLARRSAVRLVLGRYLGCDPAELRLVTAPGGKPVLLPCPAYGKGIAFSTGHSGDLYCIAVSIAASVGLDLELVRPLPRAYAIADRWFGRAEADHLKAFAEDEAPAEFMRMWTAKEALAKRHGAGLRLMRGREGELDIEAASAQRLLRFFSPGPGYMGAIASTEVIDDLEVIRPGDDVWIT